MTHDDMIEGDSKEMAHAGSGGMEWDLRSSSGLDAEGMRILLERWLLLIARRIVGDGPMLGHVKGVFRCKEGWMRTNLVDPRLAMDVEGEFGGTVFAGRMKVMAALVGRSDDQVMEGLLRGTEALLEEYAGRISIVRTTGKENFVRTEGLT